jgi:hypothetical protein
MAGEDKQEGEGQQTIELSTLSVQQLQMLRQQTEEELDFLVKSHSQLISALKRFKASASCLSAIQPENDSMCRRDTLALIRKSTASRFNCR